MIISAFTCTGPYAVLIMTGIKRVENRSAMPSPTKGRCAISCSKRFCAAEYGAFVRWAALALEPEDFELIPAWCDVKGWPGKIVGCCDYEAGTARPESAPHQAELLPTPRGEGGASAMPWDEGYSYWWNLSEVVCFDRPIPCRGNVGMWQMPPDLARRVTEADEIARGRGRRIASPEDAAPLFRLAMAITKGAEGFFVLPLDDERRALGEPVLVSLGTSGQTTTVDLREVFRAAFEANAKAIIVAHNHPGGTLAPSREDVELTRQLFFAADLLGVKLLDHLIVTQEGVQSIVPR